MAVIAIAGPALLLTSFIFAVNCASNENALTADAGSSTLEHFVLVHNLSLKNGSREDGRFDWLDTWEPPGRLKEWFPFHKLGPDYEGAPVFLCLFGRWNLRRLFTQGTEEEKSAIETYVKFINEWFIRDSLKSEHGSGVVIYDWEGFSLASYTHPEVSIFRELVETQKSINYGFAINTNFAGDSFLRISRPFLGTFLEKFAIYGPRKAKWQPRVLSKIPADSLPTQYGGTKIIDF